MILRALTDADAELEDLYRPCRLGMSDHDQARSGCFHQLPALSQETTDASHLSTDVDTNNWSCKLAATRICSKGLATEELVVW